MRKRTADPNVVSTALLGILALCLPCCCSTEPANTGEQLESLENEANEHEGGGGGESSADRFSSTATPEERAGVDRSSCSGTTPLLGATSRARLEHQGYDREYLVYYPSNYDPSEPTPLLLNFHGTDGSASQQAGFSQMNEVAEQKGLIIVYPEGLPLDGTKVFDAGLRDFSCEPRDDVDFARAIVDHIAASSCVNRRRVYATGMSNGGRMSYRMACHASNWIAAIAPVSGSLSMGDEECDHQRAVPTVHYHGTADEVAPYSTAGGLSLRAVPDLFDSWSEWSGCTDDPEEVFVEGGTTCRSRDECVGGAEVTLCTTEGGGHCWFGNPECYLGDSTTDISASSHMVDFLLRFELPLGLEAPLTEAPALPELAGHCLEQVGGASGK